MEVPGLFLPFLRHYIRYTAKCLPQYVIEGAAIFPSQMEELRNETDFRCCFLGASAISLPNVIDYASIDDWVSPLDENGKRALPEKIIEFSKLVGMEAAKRGFSYFDVAFDRDAKIEAAYKELIGSATNPR